jgi:hypothetical protein
MRKKLIASIAGITNTFFDHSDDDGTMVWDRRNMAPFVVGLADRRHPSENNEARARGLVSAFDVDGPCLVAIPHNCDWEMLPRPELRSMSICWVVEPVTCIKEPRGE